MLGFQDICIRWYLHFGMGFPGGALVKNLPANAGDAGDVSWIPWSRKQQPTPVFLEKSYDKGAWWAAVHRVERRRTQLSTHVQATLAYTLAHHQAPFAPV